MNITRKKSRISETQVRHTTRLEGDECSPTDPAFRYHQFQLINTISQSPELLQCGMDHWEKVVIFFSGRCWVAEAEAVANDAILVEANRPQDVSRKSDKTT